MSPFTKTRTRFATLFFMLSMLVPLFSQAQSESDLTEFLKTGPEDASKLTQAYLNPLIEGLSYGFNGGWMQTAKAHKTLGFDLMINVNAVFIPSSKNYFDPMKLGLTTITDFESANGKAPTIVGPDDETQYTSTINVDQDGDGIPEQTQSFTFAGPEGFDLENTLKVASVAAPTVTFGIGVYKNTDLRLRWVPLLGSDNSKIQLFGVGIMHDIKQHIPGFKLVPFDLSVFAAFTKIKGYSDLASDEIPPADGDTSPQEINYAMNAWLVQAMISKKFSVITLYGALGYNAVKTEADITGSYKIYEDASGAGDDIVFTDPVALSFKNNGFRTTAGFRLKLAVLCLSADYTFQEYNTLSVGIGVAVR
jgi:hypothetical protein